MSIAVRRSLGRRLQRLREAASKSMQDVAVTKIVSKTTLHAIESGERWPRVSHLMALARLYGLDDDTLTQLLKMASLREKGWWEDHTELIGRDFQLFIELESAADQVRSYDSELLYGLLQTPAYHRALFDADPGADPKNADAEIQFRRQRQRATLGRDSPLRIASVLNEGILARRIGGSAVHDEQLKHLLSLNSRPNINLRVLPYDVGAHAALSGPFQIVSFDEPDNPDVGYVETVFGVRYVEEVDRLSLLKDRFASIRSQAIPLEEFVR